MALKSFGNLFCNSNTFTEVLYKETRLWVFFVSKKWKVNEANGGWLFQTFYFILK